MSSTVAAILQRAVDGERLTLRRGRRPCSATADLLALGRAADAVCQRLHPEPYRTYNIDRNINYTNVCAAVCDFCAFYRKVGDAEAYVLDRDGAATRRSEETVALGGDQILMQGGLHPDLQLEWYEELLRDIKAHFPQVNIHGFSPPEIHHFPRWSSCRCGRCSSGSRTAGLGSLPGGGGEILVDRVRKAMTRGKVLTDDWLERPPRLARARRAIDGHDDVRPHRDAGGADRAPRARPPAPGRDRRLHRVHLLDVPARAHRHGRRARRPGRSSICETQADRRGSTSTTCPTSSRRG